MQLTTTEEKAIKAIFDDYYIGALNAENALYELEQLINNSIE